MASEPAHLYGILDGIDIPCVDADRIGRESDFPPLASISQVKNVIAWAVADAAGSFAPQIRYLDKSVPGCFT